jgi:Gram-negative bacterial TonB protein C-terminal
VSRHTQPLAGGVGLGLAALSLVLHVAALAVAQAWVRPPAAAWTQSTPMKDAVRVTLAPPPSSESPLRMLDAAPPGAAAWLATPIPSLATAATIEPVALAAAAAPLADLPVSARHPANAYYRLGELTKRPLLVTPIELLVNAPVTAIRPGRMRIRLMISPSGRIDEVIIDDSSLGSTLRDEVTARFANAVYEPGEIDGRPVPSQVTIEIRS